MLLEEFVLGEQTPHQNQTKPYPKRNSEADI